MARTLWAFLALGVVVQVGVVVYGSASPSVCFSTATTGLFTVDGGGDGYLGAGVRTSIGTQGYCFDGPSGGVRTLAMLETIPGRLGYAVLFFLLKRLLDGATDHGVLTTSTASRLRAFGWYLLIALPVLTLVEAVARQSLLRRALTEPTVDRYGLGFYQVLGDWGYPWWSVVVGVGVLALSKLVRDGVAARSVPATAG